MSDSLRTDRPRALHAESDRGETTDHAEQLGRDEKRDEERDEKIEQLLLLGLDHYFASHYDQAINVWTRALFLDRSHARARAYIERARSAVAERQRQSEELLQVGVAAFERGEGGEARRLLREAIEAGAPPDEAVAVLDRLNRLEEAARPVGSPEPQRRRQSSLPSRPGGGARADTGFWLTLSAIVILASCLYVAVASGTVNLRTWSTDVPVATGYRSDAGAPLARDAELPLPRRGEAALVRARALAAGGHLREALAILDIVRPTDPQRPEADRLRTDVQHQLLSLAAPIGVP